MISIIIPVYNHFSELNQCLKTIQAQTYRDFEVIIVDDCSENDNINNKNFDNLNLNIKKFRLDKNTGGNAARNYGFQKSVGEYVVFIDADLELREDFLQKLLEALRHNPQSAYVYPSFRYGKKSFPLYEFNAEKMQKDNFVSIASLIRRETFPGFDESLKRFQDWDLWLTMLEQGNVGTWVPQFLYTASIAHGTKSAWLPKIAYKIPFLFKKKKLAYQKAKLIVQQKHGLDKKS